MNPYFHFQKKVLHCESKNLETLAKKYRTPLYVYSGKAIADQYQGLKKAFEKKLPKTDIQIHFSVKSNPLLGILKLLKKLGSHFDIVSGGELYRLKKISVPGKKIVFSGVGKSEKEIIDALDSKILMINVESLPELERIIEIAKDKKIKAPLSIRVNPDVDADTHDYITTGTIDSKFGIEMDEALRIYFQYRNHPHVNWVGLDMHIGSQLTETQPIIDSLRKYSSIARSLIHQGVDLKYLDIGGGLGISYREEKIITPETLANLVKENLGSELLQNRTLVLEPGRFILGSSALLLTQVEYVKAQGSKQIIIVDAGMNDLIRPALYEAFHEILPVHQGKLTNTYDIVGPVCESSDVFASNRKLPTVQQQDILAIADVGAYGSSMASTYNSRCRPMEILVDDSVTVLRRRDTYEDNLMNET